MPSRAVVHSILTFAAWLTFTLASVWLATRGPRLWASAPFGHSADDALVIVGVGQLFFIVVALPIVLRTSGTAVGIAASAAMVVAVVGTRGHTGLLVWIELAAKLALIVAMFDGIWTHLPRLGISRRTIWSGALLVVVGWPVVGWLSADYASRSTFATHVLPLRLLTTTFLHD